MQTSTPNTKDVRAVSQQRSPMRAAEYVRMSTEHQRYSTENQSAAIARHAERLGLQIVQTYADHGKSGLTIGGRDALKRLMADVESGNANFDTVLVYDVSRWGRFQDADEGAYYEYICKRAGITVQYCAEQFENDGSISSTIVKTVKRAMAGEYSRELSVKVFAGQCRLIEHGFRQGGAPGYGLRRLLIDESRHPKGELGRGEHKSLQTDRVILVPGPADEVELVNRIYRLFVLQGRREAEIATMLNTEGHTTDLGRPWTRGTIHQVLTAEKYIGNNVFNRVSFKLKQRRITNTPDQWIRAPGAFEPIVDPEFFDAARRLIVERSRRFSDDELLDRLKAIFSERGWLSGLVIDDTDGMPSSSVYRSRFGSLLRAYQLVGYQPDRDYRYIEINRTLRRMHPGIVTTTIADIERVGGVVRTNTANDLLDINGEFTASVIIARCLTTPTGSRRWIVRFDTSLRPDITVAIRMDQSNQSALDYYLLPWIDMQRGDVRLAEENGIFLDTYRFDSLDAFARISARANIRVAA